MADPDAVILQLEDPLGPTTRHERRSLLASSTIALAIVHARILPNRINAFGVEFSNADRRALLLLLAGIVVYFMLAFLVYAMTDFVRWRLTIFAAWSEEVKTLRQSAHDFFSTMIRDPSPLTKQVRELLMRRTQSNARMLSLSIPASIIRAILEFLVPVAIGVSAVWSLLSAR